MSVPPRQFSLSGRHTIADVSPRHEPGPADFTNVTELSWPDVAVHPRYAGERGYRELRGAISVDLGACSYEVLARLSWLVAAGVPE